MVSVVSVFSVVDTEDASTVDDDAKSDVVDDVVSLSATDELDTSIDEVVVSRELVGELGEDASLSATDELDTSKVESSELLDAVDAYELATEDD